MLQASFEPVSNREDWIQQCEVRNGTGALVDLTGSVIVLTVREHSTQQQKLLGQTSDGSVVIQGPGLFQFTFPLNQMHGLTASKAYDIGCTIKLSGGPTKQYFVGTVPIIDGIVP